MRDPQTARHEIVEIAWRAVAGEIDMLEACRGIVRRHRALEGADADDPAFTTLTAIDSETDDLPVGDERASWDPTTLTKKDDEMKRYVQRVKVPILDACRSIIARLGSASIGVERAE